MYTRLNALLKEQLDKNHPVLLKNIAKTKNGIYDRLFDSLNVLEPEVCDDLVAKMIPLVDGLLQGLIKNVKGFKEIHQQNKMNFMEATSHFSVEAMSAYIESQTNRRSAIQAGIEFIANNLLEKAIIQVLDGRGNLRWDLVTQLRLNDGIDKSKAIRNPHNISLVVSGYFSAAVAQVAEKLTAKDTIGYTQALEGIKKGLRSARNLDAIEKQVRATQKVDREHEFATRFVNELTAIGKTNLTAHENTLELIVQADFDTFAENTFLQESENRPVANHLRQKKLSFWLDVMFQLIADKKDYETFSVIFSVFQENLRVESESPKKGEKGIDLQLLEKNPEKQDLYTLCLHEQDEYDTRVRKEEDLIEDQWVVVDLQNKLFQDEFIAKLQRFLNVHTCYLAIDLVVQTYVHPRNTKKIEENERPALRIKESTMISKLIEISQGEGVFENEDVIKLLDDHLPSEGGLLQEILQKSKEIFGAHLETTNPEPLARIASISTAMSSSRSLLRMYSSGDSEEKSPKRESVSCDEMDCDFPEISPKSVSSVVPTTPVRALFNGVSKVPETKVQQLGKMGNRLLRT